MFQFVQKCCPCIGKWNQNNDNVNDNTSQHSNHSKKQKDKKIIKSTQTTKKESATKQQTSKNNNLNYQNVSDIHSQTLLEIFNSKKGSEEQLKNIDEMLLAIQPYGQGVNLKKAKVQMLNNISYQPSSSSSHTSHKFNNLFYKKQESITIKNQQSFEQKQQIKSKSIFKSQEDKYKQEIKIVEEISRGGEWAKNINESGFHLGLFIKNDKKLINIDDFQHQELLKQSLGCCQQKSLERIKRRGTVIVLSSIIIMTAAHNILTDQKYSEEEQFSFESFSFYPYINGKLSPSSFQCKVASFIFREAYVDKNKKFFQKFEDDFVILLLDKPMIEFKVIPFAKNIEKQYSKVVLQGYSDIKEVKTQRRKNKQYDQVVYVDKDNLLLHGDTGSAKIQQVENCSLLNHTVNCSAGASGAPLINITDQKTLQLIAMHIFGDAFQYNYLNKRIAKNYALPFHKQLLENIESSIKLLECHYYKFTQTTQQFSLKGKENIVDKFNNKMILVYDYMKASKQLSTEITKKIQKQNKLLKGEFLQNVQPNLIFSQMFPNNSKLYEVSYLLSQSIASSSKKGQNYKRIQKLIQKQTEETKVLLKKCHDEIIQLKESINLLTRNSLQQISKKNVNLIENGFEIKVKKYKFYDLRKNKKEVEKIKKSKVLLSNYVMEENEQKTKVSLLKEIIYEQLQMNFQRFDKQQGFLQFFALLGEQNSEENDVQCYKMLIKVEKIELKKKL